MTKRALLITCFDWFSARLKPIKQYLTEKKYDVTVLTSDFDHINKTYYPMHEPECNYIHVPLYRTNISIQRIWSHLYFGKQVGLWLKKLKPNFIYLVLPPNNIACYCAKYKKKHPECKYIIDIIDLWPESMPLGFVKNSLPAKFWRKLRDDSLLVADHIFLECDLYKEKLSYLPNIAEKSSVLYLFKKQTYEEREMVLSMIKQYEIEKDSRNNKVILGYLGSINSIIDIDGITRVVRSFIVQEKEVEVRIIGDGESRQKLIYSLEKVGANVVYYGKIFNQLEKIKILGSCDFGLNMMTKRVTVGLTIKSIDYFSFGLPILNNLNGDTKDFVNRFKIGINVRNNNVIGFNSNFNRFKILEIFEQMFSKRSFAQKFRDCYKTLI